jgi:pyruvate/2-oxoglutarate dehydrogenase complex dihydrolipoamide dehydrogenase (E3) component
MTKFDAIVIGSGQGGNPLCQALADIGWKVALVEKRYLGGTCINTGCTPTKTMIASAQVAHYARNGAKWGVHADNVRVDMPEIVARKARVVELFRGGQQKRDDARPNLSVFHGQARFLSKNQIQVNSEVLESEKIFIDTGTRPAMPKMAGLEAIPTLNNESIMELQELPEHLLIMGGGYIGLEFGQMFRRFGCEVTVLHTRTHVLPEEDEDVSDELQRVLEAEGIRFSCSTNTTKGDLVNGEIVLNADCGGKTMRAAGSHLLLAVGRIPNTDDMGLDKAGVEVDSRGYVKTNERMETSASGIWALGDVKGGPAFTHISYNDYQILWGNLIEGKNLSIKDRYLPYALFTDPQLGRVGLTEKAARATGRKLKIGKYPMANVSRAIERDETAGFMKIVIDAATDRILGASILGSEGGETVQILGALMLADAPYTVLKGAVFIHPTMAEGLFGLLDTVKAVD